MTIPGGYVRRLYKEVMLKSSTDSQRAQDGELGHRLLIHSSRLMVTGLGLLCSCINLKNAFTRELSLSLLLP